MSPLVDESQEGISPLMDESREGINTVEELGDREEVDKVFNGLMAPQGADGEAGAIA